MLQFFCLFIFERCFDIDYGLGRMLEISFSFQYLILGQIDSYRVFCKLELSIVMLAVIQVSFDKYSSSGMKTNMLLHGLPEYRYLSI